MLGFLAVVAGAALVAATNTYGPFDNLVAFGDSYSDDGRLAYYISNNGSAPPAGAYQTVTNVTASGGLTWGQYVQQRVPGLGFFDYAVSGATCSNRIVARELPPIHGPFPAVLDDEIPSFQADVAGAHTLYANRTADNTVYALWIGTNDLSFSGFLSDSQALGTNITTFVECTWAVLDALYAAGARRFVLFNQAPLHLAPMYRPQAAGGAGDNQYWANKTQYNETAYAYKMLEYTTSVNTIVAYGAPFQLLVRRRWLGAAVALFDVHRLLTDVYADPAAYLAAPANATGYFHHCDPTNTTQCTDAPGSIDSYMFFDELHPSTKTDSVIAEAFLDVVAGISEYGTTYSS
ncbi:carbohydrate esterase family 16 protein [Niveomyces insectorum RCEF 264]|uniref:Carbohydrate esterase family 16 protein n=1 Tax=Niveomyces insectorum RCEF 264 TaxID=1081102 RepID=A0A167N2G3_9HYPO|nr:carbohydrate esterase family 16 protein [Niveomyces insectorum RCEF 264]